MQVIGGFESSPLAETCGPPSLCEPKAVYDGVFNGLILAGAALQDANPESTVHTQVTVGYGSSIFVKMECGRPSLGEHSAVYDQQISMVPDYNAN